VGKVEERFVRSLIGGRTWREAAQEVGLSERRARSFLESVARFAGAVEADVEFVRPKATAGETGGAGRVRYGRLILHTDGASIGNPGPAGAGGVLSAPDGTVVEEFHEHLGRATNNVAEYEAVRIGLSKAIDWGARSVLVRLDSELVANQLSGRFRVRDPKLLEAYLKVESLLSRLDEVEFETIPREQNTRADQLAQIGARSGSA